MRSEERPRPTEGFVPAPLRTEPIRERGNEGGKGSRFAVRRRSGRLPAERKVPVRIPSSISTYTSFKPEHTAGNPPAWLPPLVSVAALFVLFLTATGVRRSSFADACRPVMVTLSTAASVAIALYGVKLLVASRMRGLASAVSGAVMLLLGITTIVHVLK